MKRRCILVAILFVLMLMIISCGTSGQSTLTHRRDQWASQGVENYRYRLRMYCLCPYTESVIVEVRDGRAVSVENWSGAPSSGEIDFSQYFEHADTIDKLFGLIERALEEGADVVSVGYDEEYGFPTDISIDWYREGYDDEVRYTVSGFEILE